MLTWNLTICPNFEKFQKNLDYKLPHNPHFACQFTHKSYNYSFMVPYVRSHPERHSFREQKRSRIRPKITPFLAPRDCCRMLSGCNMTWLYRAICIDQDIAHKSVAITRCCEGRFLPNIWNWNSRSYSGFVINYCKESHIVCDIRRISEDYFNFTTILPNLFGKPATKTRLIFYKAMVNNTLDWFVPRDHTDPVSQHKSFNAFPILLINDVWLFYFN